VILVILLTACTTRNNLADKSADMYSPMPSNLSQSTSLLRSADVQIVSFDSLLYKKLSLNINNRIKISETSPIIKFTEGNAFVAALVIPDSLSKFTFLLKSTIGNTVFIPHVIFLNQNLQEVGRIDDISNDNAGNLLMRKTFDENLAMSMRYIIVYSQDKDLDGKTELFDISREYEIKKGRVVPESNKLYAKHEPIGTINIAFEDVFYSAHSLSQSSTSGEDSIVNGIIEDNEVQKKSIMLSDTKFYLDEIGKAIKDGDLEHALRLIEKAKLEL
jgi:maltose operon periplasmic protein